MLFKLSDGSFCISVLEIKSLYYSSYCVHFTWIAKSIFLDFVYSTPICLLVYRQYEISTNNIYLVGMFCFEDLSRF